MKIIGIFFGFEEKKNFSNDFIFILIGILKEFSLKPLKKFSLLLKSTILLIRKTINKNNEEIMKIKFGIKLTVFNKFNFYYKVLNSPIRKNIINKKSI